MCMRFVNKVESFPIADLKSSDYRRWSKLTSVKRLFVDLIADIVLALENKEDLQRLLHFVTNNLIRLKRSELQRI